MLAEHIRNVIKTRIRIRSIYIATREDRYGANAIPWMTAILYSRCYDVPLYHDCSSLCDRYRGTVMHDILLEHSRVAAVGGDSRDRSREILAEQLPGVLFVSDLDGWIRGFLQLLMTRNGGLPLPDALSRSGLKEEFYSRFQEKAMQQGWAALDSSVPTIAVHVRLDDVRDKANGDRQKFIGEEGLSELLRELHRRFPAHEIALITTPDETDLAICRRSVMRSGIPGSVLGNQDIDRDLWLMMTSDILIMSRSSFAILAGLLHQGAAVYTYERWKHFDEIVGWCYLPDPGHRSVLFSELQW